MSRRESRLSDFGDPIVLVGWMEVLSDLFAINYVIDGYQYGIINDCLRLLYLFYIGWIEIIREVFVVTSRIKETVFLLCIIDPPNLSANMCHRPCSSNSLSVIASALRLSIRWSLYSIFSICTGAGPVFSPRTSALSLREIDSAVLAVVRVKWL